MLIYELFLKNKDEQDGPGEKVPCKKIFIKHDIDELVVEIDPTTPEEYGAYFLPDNSLLQKALGMPLLNQSSVNLPVRSTGSNSNPPYIQIYCNIKGKKMTMSLKGKHPKNQSKTSFDFEYDFATNQEKLDIDDGIKLRLEPKKYHFNGTPIYELYKDAGIIDNSNVLKESLFKKICKDFLNYCLNRKIQDNLSSISKFAFRLVLLPYCIFTSPNDKIVYSDGQTEGGGSQSKDSFDYAMNSTAKSPVIDKNAKFLSYDDPAFTINCRQGEDFYKNLGIGDQAIDKIMMPHEYRIAGLTWFFFSLSPALRASDFEKKPGGIYQQLRQIHYELSQSGPLPRQQSELKIICTKKTQAKIEVLLNENLTLDQLAENLKFNKYPDNLPILALETLIKKNKKGENVDWSLYIDSLRKVLNGVGVERELLLKFYTMKIRENLFDWLNGSDKRDENATDFFWRSSFCFNILIQDQIGEKIMNPSEEYAYKIGQIAGTYIKYKREADETTHSTNDILTYTKYDREKLRFVYQKVALGLFLSKNLDAKEKMVETEVQNLAPTNEIDDANADTDYSYFFYKGVFERLGDRK